MLTRWTGKCQLEAALNQLKEMFGNRVAALQIPLERRRLQGGGYLKAEGFYITMGGWKDIPADLAGQAQQSRRL